MPMKLDAPRCLVVLLCALSPWSVHAQSSGPGDMGLSFERPNVARMTDSDASCEQLFAEADHLERQVAAMPKPEDPAELSQKMTAEIMESQQKAVQSMRSRSVASSLLSMVPGVGGLAAQAVAPGMGGMRADTSETMQKHMKALQDSTEASMAIYQLQARQEHLTDLFLDRNCKVSQLDPGALAKARETWKTASAATTVATAAPAAATATAETPKEAPTAEPVPPAAP